VTNGETEESAAGIDGAVAGDELAHAFEVAEGDGGAEGERRAGAEEAMGDGGKIVGGG
jgi:hypothetical protein